MQREKDLPRGIRNNNPGNLIDSGIDWWGKTGVDGIFVVFSEMRLGIRAWFKNYITAVTRHKADTVYKFIHRYAPASHKGNNTEAYIKAVCEGAQLEQDSLMPMDEEGMTTVFKTMMRVENGAAADVITDADIMAGWAMANTKNTKKTK